MKKKLSEETKLFYDEFVRQKTNNSLTGYVISKDKISESVNREFSKELREKIRIRDNYKCQKCWKNEIEYERNENLETHHIDYDKNNNREENLISLCRSCHAKTNFSKEDWQKHFQDFLNKPKIYVAILNQGEIRVELFFALLKWFKEDEYRIYLELPSDRPIENNRNKIVKKFLSSDADYLLQIDEDNLPSKNPLNLVDLMQKKNIDIISCPVWIYQQKLMLNIYKYDANKEYLIPINYGEYSGLVEIDATGTGVILCSRNALKHIKKPFERIYDENGIATYGLDLAFSHKAKEAKFKIYTHLDYISKHYKTIDLSILMN